MLNNGEFSLAPYYSQECVAREIIHFINGNTEEIKRIMNYIGRFVSIGDQYGKFSIVDRMFRFSAAAGVGKTQAVIPMVELVQDKINRRSSIFIAPTQDVLDKFGSSESKFLLSDFINKIKSSIQFNKNGQIVEQ